MKLINNALAILAILFGFSLSSCSDDDGPCPDTPDLSGVNETQLQADIAAIDEYLDENNIEAIEHSSGLRYIIFEEGTGATPDLCHSVQVAYTGRLMSNGEIFDQSPYGALRTFELSNLILGWQIGLPLIREGGEIRLFIPSQLAYKNQPPSSIPSNANLIFSIELEDVP